MKANASAGKHSSHSPSDHGSAAQTGQIDGLPLAEPSVPVPDGGYEASYSESRFRDKLNRFAKMAGRELVHKSLCLYYAAKRPATPAWAKATVYAALGYFILPTDAIPDLTPLVGYGDDLGAISLALATIAAHVTPEVRARAAQKIREWFGEADPGP